MEGASGKPEREERNESGGGGCVVRSFRRGNPLNRPLPEPLGMLGDSLFEIIGHKRRDRGGAPGKKSQAETDACAADHRPRALLDIGPGRHPVVDLPLTDGGDLLLHIDHDLS